MLKSTILAVLLLTTVGCTTHRGTETHPRCTSEACEQCAYRCAASNAECRAHCYSLTCAATCDDGQGFCLKACPDQGTVDVPYTQRCWDPWFCDDRIYLEDDSGVAQQ